MTALGTCVGIAVTVAWAGGCGGGATGHGGSSSSTSSASSGTGGNASSSSGGMGGGASISSYTPQGCSFSIAPRAEYVGFSLSSAKVSATPNIRRVRLGLGGNVDVGAAGRADPSTSIGVAWQTDDDTLASEIQWGNDPDPTKWPAANRASGITWSTPALTDLLGDERMHEVYLCGLTPATTYYYRVGGGPAGSEAWSDVYSFTTTPAAGSTQVTIGVTGDSRGETGDAWRAAQRRMTTIHPTLQIFSGDIVNIATDQGAWEHWLDSAWQDSDKSPLSLGNVLTLSTHGNHENHTTFFFGNLVLPQDQAKFPKYAELFYSFDVGPVHLVVVDDYWVVTPSSDPDGAGTYTGALGAWLDADLAAANANRAKVPWIVTMHHHGAFSSSTHGKDADVLRGRQFFVPIWDKHHVDVDMVGHDHNYERTKPVSGPLASDLSPVVQTDFSNGTVYVVCAGVGAPAYTSGSSAFTQTSFDWTDGSSIGVYGLATADATSFKFEAHALKADATDPIVDTFTITKP